MTKKPQPTDKLDATATTAEVSGPAGGPTSTQRTDRRANSTADLQGLLEPGAVKVARRVLRRAWAQQCARAYPTDAAAMHPFPLSHAAGRKEKFDLGRGGAGRLAGIEDARRPDEFRTAV
jgi:hypothetical protein